MHTPAVPPWFLPGLGQAPPLRGLLSIKITIHVPMLTFGKSGFPTCNDRFQIAAPEGFSA